ncbi:MAG TPA: S8 family serine peptidase [Saprospiraceae bacterium]|nr:S8 family serine peptidase [Saprospiraceae bacterium]
MKKLCLAFLLLLVSTPLIIAQTPAGPASGRLLVQLNPGTDVQHWLKSVAARLPGLRLAKEVARDWDIYLLDAQLLPTADAEGLLDAVQHLPQLRFAQWDASVQYRSTTPNDPNFGQQIDMSLISAPDAWDAGIGGVTPRGDTIVVAVLEKGVLLNHPDLVPNLWHNWQEIPNNGIDDDGNGFVDDHLGYDVRKGGSSSGTGGTHGTSVFGIVGAAGNNGQGVTGVNWNVKLMNLTHVDSIHEVVRAYNYVWKMRRLYNQTQGVKGAFVVSSNASFGYDGKFPSFAPLWCQAYDSLGRVGIVSVGATTNSNDNVDQVGDLPSTCPSEYLIVVNNVYSSSGNKYPATGTGKVHVDLGAPGDGTYTTVNGSNGSGSYATFSGTSAAAPHMSGAVALAYTWPCDLLANDALSSPAACASRVRALFLDNTVQVASLQNVTATGGRLDLGAALQATRKLCQGTIGPLSIIKVAQKDDNLFTIQYQTPSTAEYTFRVFNMLGQLMHEEVLHPQQFAPNLLDYDASPLPSGVYAFTISRGEAKVSKKFRKIR